MWPFRKREPGYRSPEAQLAHQTAMLADRYESKYQPVLDISEPVRSIAQAMRERPGSFRVSCERPIHGHYTGYDIKDRRTGLAMAATEIRILGEVERSIILPFSLTEDETEFLWVEAEKWLRERKQRAEDYINAKRRREWSRKYGVGS